MFALPRPHDSPHAKATRKPRRHHTFQTLHTFLTFLTHRSARHIPGTARSHSPSGHTRRTDNPRTRAAPAARTPAGRSPSRSTPPDTPRPPGRSQNPTPRAAAKAEPPGHTTSSPPHSPRRTPPPPPPPRAAPPQSACDYPAPSANSTGLAFYRPSAFRTAPRQNACSLAKRTIGRVRKV